MADKEPVIADDDNDDTLNLTDKLDDQAQQGDADAGNQSGDDDQQGDDEGEEQPSVSFEGEEASNPESENTVIRGFRQRERDLLKRLAEAEKASAPKPIEIGEKPTLIGCEYDEERYEAELDAWKDRTAAAARQNESQAEQSRRANEAWQQDLTTFEAKKTGLEFEDRDEAIQSVIGSFPTEWHAAAIIKAVVAVGGDPALFFYALSKSEAKRTELSKMDDPIKVGAVVARMEGAVKVTRKAPAPDRAQRGSAAMPAGGTDKELEKLEKEADRTGDRTKVIAHKNALKAAAKEK